MLKQTIRFTTVLTFLLGLALFSPVVFAQGYHGRHGTRHYYHNGNWNRNGWYGWGVPAPVYANGVLVSSLPPGYTTVIVGGNPYFYGNDTYFRQMSNGGYAVVTL